MNSIRYEDGRAYLKAQVPTAEKARGINTHNWLAHFFVDAFGSGTVKLEDGTYLNKASCFKWINNLPEVDKSGERFKKFKKLGNVQIIRQLEDEIKPLKSHYEETKSSHTVPVVPKPQPTGSSSILLFTKQEIKRRFEELLSAKNSDDKFKIGIQLSAGYYEDDCPVLVALREFMTSPAPPSNFSIDVAKMTDNDQKYLSQFLMSEAVLLKAQPMVPEPKPASREKIPLPDPTQVLSEQEILAQFKKIYQAKNHEDRKKIAEELRLRVIDTQDSLNACPFARDLFFYFYETQAEFKFKPKSSYNYLDRHILSSFLENCKHLWEQ